MKSSIVTLLLCFLVLCCSKEGSPTQAPLEGENGITASYKIDAVEHLALSVDSTLRLVSIESNAMDVDGTSKSWLFMYCRTLSPFKAYYFTATPDSIIFDSISTRVPLGSAFISQTWVNSSVAAQVAESMGGKTFRSNNPDCSIAADLGEPVVPNPAVSWWIVYRSNSDATKYQSFTVDARSIPTNQASVTFGTLP